MSNKKKPQQPADASRSRGAALMQQQRSKEKRRNALIQGGIALAAVVAVLLVTVAVLNARSAGAPEVMPDNVTEDGAYVVGDADADTTIRVVEDLQCPACKAFEEANGDTLRELADSGDVTVEYQGVAFLDRASSTDYSSRALNAWACVADGSDVETWRTFQEQMYAQQPAEGGEGLTDEQIAQIAVDAGADETTVTSCIEDGTFADWVAYTTDQARDNREVRGTPTVFLDGEVTEARTPEDLRAAVEEAQQS